MIGGHDERIAAIADEASKIILALLTGVRGGAQPSLSPCGRPRRARLALPALASELDSPRPDTDEPA